MKNKVKAAPMAAAPGPTTDRVSGGVRNYGPRASQIQGLSGTAWVQ